MRAVRLESGPRSYVDDNTGLIRDVAVAIRDLFLADEPLGQLFRPGPKASLYVLETANHRIIYQWGNPLMVVAIMPKG